MSTAVFCTASSPQTKIIVEELRKAGFSSNDISVLMADKTGTKDFAVENDTKAPEGTATGTGAGMLLGGGLGWLAGIGALAIPGVGPLIAAGPIMAALSGAALGGTIGGVTGCLVGMGIPEYEAKKYEGKLQSGGTLISVHSENSEETSRAKSIFQKFGGEDISSGSEAAVAKR